MKVVVTCKFGIQGPLW